MFNILNLSEIRISEHKTGQYTTKVDAIKKVLSTLHPPLRQTYVNSMFLLSA